MKHSTAQVVDAKETRPSPAYERVWLRLTKIEQEMELVLSRPGVVV